ncbi:MAG: hypothetical protein IPH03_08885 [Tetrasphaera sp.]|nr:hypothetical protein [Tetrasphaera sp.]
MISKKHGFRCLSQPGSSSSAPATSASPAGERLLRHLLPRDRGIEVTSAGTYAVVGHPIVPSMARLLTADGVDVSGFAARRLTETLVAATRPGASPWRPAIDRRRPASTRGPRPGPSPSANFAHLVAAEGEATSTAYVGTAPPPACMSLPPRRLSGEPAPRAAVPCPGYR